MGPALRQLHTVFWVCFEAITLLVNVLARCGWTRFLAYSLVKRLGLKQAWILAPSAYGKLHDEIKIYVGHLGVHRYPCLSLFLFFEKVR